MKLSGENLHQLAEKHWVACDSAFEDAFLKTLKAIALHRWQNGQFHPAKVGRSQEQKEASEIRSDWTCWIDLEDPDFSDLKKEMDELRTFLNQNFFLGLEEFEGHLARYASGQFYDEHLDQPRLKSPLHGERVISFVLYLNENWQPDHGGELSLRISQPEIQIAPKWGRLLLFRSDSVPHAVMPARHERWSLTGWFRRH